MSFNTSPPPVVMCAVCNKPVDSLHQHIDRDTDTIHITAHCHGKVDRMKLTPFDIRNVTTLIQLSTGVAFLDEAVAALNFQKQPAPLEAPDTLPGDTR